MIWLLLIVALPLAVATTAAVLSIRDNARVAWSLVRVCGYAIAWLVLLYAFGIALWLVAASAFAIVVGLHLLGYYVVRWFLLGIKSD